MKLLCGQSNRIWHYWAGAHPGKVGLLLSPSYYTKVPVDPWMPYGLDNDAFTAWRDSKPWDAEAWWKLLAFAGTKHAPLWALVPDVVANKEATLANWPIYAPHIKSIGWKAAFAVQDGMTPDDVPADADLIFVGGTTDWKWSTVAMWASSFPHVHVGRVNALKHLDLCLSLNVDSCDGTGWFRLDPPRKTALFGWIENSLFKH